MLRKILERYVHTHTEGFMQRTATHVIRKWLYYWPILALLVLLFSWGSHPSGLAIALLGIVLGGAVMAAVEHAEVVAHKVGEPFGSLILALAVTIIEVGMIIMLMTSNPSTSATLARDTVFAATMLTTNMIIGLALLAATRKGPFAYFNKEGTGTAFTAVFVLATVTMVIPTFTTSAPEGVFATSQLIFVGVMALLIWGAFVLTQTRGHRDFFMPITKNGEIMKIAEHAARPSKRRTFASLGLLMLSLISVVGISKTLSYPIEDVVTKFHLPQALVGVVIALIVLMPETIASVNNAQRGRTQIAMNLGYGSALASIGLTIPTIGIISLMLDMRLVLGLEPVHMALLVLTGLMSALTIVQGRALRLQGAMHLVVAAAYVFLVAVP